MQAQMQQQHFMATSQVQNHMISVTERTLNTSGAYQSFGPGGNRGRFQHHGRGGNRGRFYHHGRGDYAGCHHMSDNQQIKSNRRTNRNKRIRKQAKDAEEQTRKREGSKRAGSKR